MRQDNILSSDIKLPESVFKTTAEYVWNKLTNLDDNVICLTEALSGNELTIGELKRQSHSIGVGLVNQGVTKGDKIAFSGENSIQHAVCRFAVKLLGLTFMPLSPTFEKYEVEQEVRSAGANVIISSGDDCHKFESVLEGNINNVKLVVIIDGKSETHVTYDQLLAEGRGQTLKQIPYFPVDPSTDMLFLIHTSGSTGRPKCAMIPHRVFINGTDQLPLMFRFRDIKGLKDTVSAMCYPCGHVTGTILIPMMILNGIRLVLFGKFDEQLLLKSIAKYGINALPAFPSFGRTLVAGDLLQKYDISSLKAVSIGGAAFPETPARALIQRGIQIKEVYAMTEYVWVTNGSDYNDEYIPGNTGTVAPGCQLKVVDLTTGESLGPGRDGEICIRGNKLFAGYLDNETANLEAFDKDGWYRTGDIGRYDSRERLFIVDRLKEVVRIGIDNHYINISPVEIEQFLLTHPSIAEVAVVGVNNKSGTHWPRAYVVLTPDGTGTTADDIAKFVSDTLAYTKRLKGGVVFVDRIQRTAIGKVDRKYYRNLVKDEVLDY